ncbi:PREDICTED: sushi, von Willebrand factor type A, EGF and pentraxin domain-containing protein 1-like [Branchiostoma belcheri]|uniref:Sushi, von Willebrand factor type A, EGF and pentraxin domain-containing protein 1-like n=1 Tax=Branchiostoma belcheri TaxID=7741 RepID=A0A6P5AEP8_BRABE|nr:PREDICTED: sushi, von Willebrand factor type A, EGF and pentraxin domain-containing protein 1-like [Branchiostoma belcheri]
MAVMLVLWILLFTLIHLVHGQTLLAAQNAALALTASLPRVNEQLDIVFVLDHSGSVGQQNYGRVVTFVKAVLGRFSVYPDETRVAVISYGWSATVDFDNLRSSSKDNNKCELFTTHLTKLTYRGGYTNTRDGLRKARELFLQAGVRQSSTKVVFTVTDGYWNVGGDPICEVRSLQHMGVLMFAFGIGSWGIDSYKLRGLGNKDSGGNKYVYLVLDFRALSEVARRLRGDFNTNLYLPAPLSKCVGCHSSSHVCLCGTYSGQYTCGCNPGYFCSNWAVIKCPRNTYKDHVSPGPCTPCPLNSGTLKTGSTSRSDCFCNTGYYQVGTPIEYCNKVTCKPPMYDPTAVRVASGCATPSEYNSQCSLTCKTGYNKKGGSALLTCKSSGSWDQPVLTCEKTECPRLAAPPFGSIVGSCSKLFGDVCTFQCSDGYRMSGSSATTCTSAGRWSHATPTCKKLFCSANEIWSPPNGVRQGCDDPHVAVGFSCSTTCNTGYKPVGTITFTCLANNGVAKWDAHPKACDVDMCTPLTDPQYGKVGPALCKTSPEYNTICTYTCGNDFSLQGPSSVTCLPGGTWSSPDPVICKDELKPVIECPDDTTVTAAAQKTSAKISWTVPTATDNSGVPPGVTAKIQSSGRSARELKQHPPLWLEEGQHFVTYTAEDMGGNSATCDFSINVIVTRCRRLGSPTNGATIPATCAELRGSKCQFTCDQGYDLIGADEVTCQDDSTWSHPPPTCQVVRCPSLNPPAHSTMSGCVSPTSEPYGKVCFFRCIAGYSRKSGATSRQCMNDATWSGSELQCEVTKCLGLPEPLHGTVTPTSCSLPSEYGTVCSFSCQSGFEVVGPSVKTCLYTGIWSNQAISTICQDTQVPQFHGCPPDQYSSAGPGNVDVEVTWREPTAMDNSGTPPTVSLVEGKASGSRFPEGTHNIRYTAADATGLATDCSFRIDVNVAYCSNMASLARGKTICNHSDRRYGTTCQFSCNPGYKLVGASTTVCTKMTGNNAQWSSPTRTCEVVTCSALPGPVNGRKFGCNKAEEDFGAVCSFYCNEGYSPKSPHQRICLENGTWSGTPLACEIDACPPLMSPKHGKWTPGKCSINPLYGQQCFATCDAGYSLIAGTRWNKCLDGGHWQYDSLIDCKDVHKPVFYDCPADFHVTADGGSTTVNVTWISPTATDNTDLQAPRFSTCPSDLVLYADKGEAFTVVTWTEPTANENVTRMQGPPPGSIFAEGTHTVMYVATNSVGLIATCSFRVTVQVLYCSMISSPRRGSMACDHNDDRYGTVCRFSCEEGNELVGTASIECTKDASNSTRWTSSPPTCAVVTCRSLDSPANGTKTGCSNTEEEIYGTVCNFHCNEGYSPKTVQHRSCQQDGTWSGTDLHCEIDTCSPLTDPPQGHVSPTACTTTSSVFNEDCVYVCNEGYSFEGSSHSVKCLDGGRWSVNKTAKCTAVTCPALPHPVNGIKSGCDNTIESYNTSCGLQCNMGYSPKKVQLRTCQQDGTWSGDSLHCTIDTCPPLRTPPNGHLAPAACAVSPVFGQECTYSCDVGYTLTGKDQSMTCLDGGRWQYDEPTCKLVTCSGLATPQRGTISPQSCKSTADYNTVCSFNCDSGYQVSGPSQKTCRHTGLWTDEGTSTTCIDATGPEFTSCPTSQILDAASGKINAIATWTLPTATDNSGTAPTVVRVEGPPPGSSFDDGTHTIRYTATDGAAHSTDCLFTIRVKVLYCTSLVSATSGSMTCDYGDRRFGTTCTFTCNSGYRMVGSSTTACSKDVSGGSHWTSSVPICQVDNCPSLSNPTHGQVSPSSCTASPSVNQECTFVCNTGYTLFGTGVNRCLSGGTWQKAHTTTCEDVDKPVFHNCPGDIQATAGAGSSVAHVTWTIPTATDSTGTSVHVTASGVRSTFGEGSHAISYTATDNAGNVARCQFAVIVTVYRCATLSSPTNGQIQGSCSNLRGSSCTLGCRPGYLTSGSTTRTCVFNAYLSTTYWDGTTTICQKPAPGCPTVYISGSTTVQTSLMTSYTRTANTNAERAVYSSDSTNDYLYFYEDNARDIRRWCIGPTIGQERGSAYVTAVHFNPEDIDGTWIMWGQLSWQPFSQVRCSCYDRSPGCSTIRIAGSTTVQTDRMTSYTMTGQTLTGRPVYASDSTDDFLYFYEDFNEWVVGPTLGDASRGVNTEDRHLTPEEILEPWNLWTGTQWQVFPTVGASCYTRVPGCSTIRVAGSMSSQTGRMTTYTKAGYTHEGRPVYASDTTNDFLFFYRDVLNSYYQWLIGPTVGRIIAGLYVNDRHLTAEEILATWYIFDGSQWQQAPEVKISCYSAGIVFIGKRSLHQPTSRIQDRYPFIATNNDRRLRGQSADADLPSSPSKHDDHALSVLRNEDTRNELTTEFQPKVAGADWLNVGSHSIHRRDIEITCLDGMVWHHKTKTCGIPPTIEVTGLQDSYDEGSHLVRYTATDQSGNKAKCEFNIHVTVHRCKRLPPPAFGRFTSTCDNSQDSSCTVECLPGYELTGSSVRTCVVQDNGTISYWDGTETRCKERRCDPLSVPEHSRIVPSSCTVQPKAGTDCHYGCEDHFQLVGGHVTVRCNQSGHWEQTTSGVTPICTDIKPPTLSDCPGEITVKPDPGERFADVNWDVPIATDNNGVPSVLVSPANYTPPENLPIGTYNIEYIAEDSAGLTASCSFTIHVRDEEQPMITCPSDIEQRVGSHELPITISWEDPETSDNSGVPPTVELVRGYKPGKAFNPGQWEVAYRATDDAGNYQECTFKVSVKALECSPLNEPTNGALTCGNWSQINVCSPHCEEGAVFPNDSEYPMYYCLDGAWREELLPPPLQTKPPVIRVPDCTKPSPPSAVTSTTKMKFIYDGDCKDGDVQLEIKEAFLVAIKASPVCQLVQCEKENIFVRCGTHRKRSLRQMSSRKIRQSSEEVTIAFTISSTAGNYTNNQTQSSDDVLFSVENAVELLQNATETGQMDIEMDGVKIEAIQNYFQVSETQMSCPSGMVWTDTRGACVGCPAGFYLNEVNKTCTECPLGSYQEQINQLSCVKCPRGTWTESAATRNISYCKELCQPGTFSSTTMAPCENCPIGTYQTEVGSSSCTNCQPQQTTNITGSTSSNFCFERCSPGSFSVNGLAPCTPCPRGQYQPESQRTSCLKCPMGYSTTSNGSKSSKECFNVDECSSFPCANNGTCLDRINGYICQCPAGFGGDLCEETINECSSNPCLNGLCLDGISGYTCSCTAGFTGHDCSTNIDDCESNDCSNGATCVDGINEYRCSCLSGYTGTFCDVDIDECASNPCLHGGTCTDSVNGYVCRCRYGYTGTLCEVNIDDCDLSPCVNNGTCIDGVGNYTCVCTSGFTGENCENNTNECSSSPCTNNGTCVDLAPGFVCDCAPGYAGNRCEEQSNECESSPCQNIGTCEALFGSYTCHCSVGYTGVNCETVIDFCASFPCSNGGNCSNVQTDFSCECPPGYDGLTCETERDECDSLPCKNGGTCLDVVNGYTCQCQKDYTGTNCESTPSPCASGPCHNGANCTDMYPDYLCSCSAGFTGSTCNINVPECSSNPCQNGGLCTDGIDSFSCRCLSGFEGEVCQIQKNECEDPMCENGGTCIDTYGAFECDCPPGFNGSRCENNIDYCVDHNCNNGAECVDGVASYSCSCQVGYEGEWCSEETDECSSNPCVAALFCQDLHNAYHCECETGFIGVNCEINADDCENVTCFHGGECVDGVAWFTCNCPDGITGDLCQTDEDECLSGPCQSSGTCVDGMNSNTCLCSTGYTGTNCELDVDECITSPCENGAVCTNYVGNYSCTCLEGYTGQHCNINVDDCPMTTCYNNGTCVDKLNGTLCLCVTGFTGEFCQVDIDDCLPDTCNNGGTCVDGVNNVTCQCAPGYEGDYCELDINECSSLPCQHGGNCTDRINDYTCSCHADFTGKDCNISVTGCSQDLCKNAATCKEIVGGFLCICKPSFTGTLCETELSSEFDIFLNGGDDSYASTDYNIPDMDAFTLAFWMQTTDRTNYGTPFSYATNGDNAGSDNALTISDYTGFTLLVNGEAAYTGIAINDDNWHHITITWESVLGQWTAFYDGVKVQSEEGLQAGAIIPGGGLAIVGQEQDFFGGGFSPDEAFKGHLHGLNWWSRALSDSEISELGASCNHTARGDIHTWADFVPNSEGNVKVSNVSLCDDTKKCASSPCINNATCTSFRAGYECACSLGFGGKNCEIDVDDCFDVICQHGGTCVDKVDGYECTCAIGFHGRNCELEVSTCSPNPCQYDGECTEKEFGTYNCSCRPGYLGTDCDVELNECASDPCFNDATCVDLVDNYYCDCPYGFFGKDCNGEIDYCDPNLCQHGGTCIPIQNDYRCSCSVGYMGYNCEIDIDECEGVTCMNSGTCVDGVASYNCACARGFTGSHCETNIDECEAIVCLNGGTCVDGIGSFTCDCPASFTGTMCDLFEIHVGTEGPNQQSDDIVGSSEKSVTDIVTVASSIPSDVSNAFASPPWYIAGISIGAIVLLTAVSTLVWKKCRGIKVKRTNESSAHRYMLSRRSAVSPTTDDFTTMNKMHHAEKTNILFNPFVKGKGGSVLPEDFKTEEVSEKRHRAEKVNPLLNPFVVRKGLNPLAAWDTSDV